VNDLNDSAASHSPQLSRKPNLNRSPMMTTQATLPSQKSRHRISASQLESLAGNPPTKPQDRIAEALQVQARSLLEMDIDYMNHEEFSDASSSDRVETILATKYENKRKPRVKPSPDLPAYFARLYETPLLTPQEEHDLFWAMNYLKYRANMLRLSLDANQPDEMLMQDIKQCLAHSKKVRDRIVQANLRLVVSLARKFADQYSSFDELVSDGNVTLMNAAEKFDCSRGFRFSTYATHATQRDFYRQLNRRRKSAMRITGDQNEFLGQIGYEEVEEDVPMKTQGILYQKVMEVFGHELDEREQHIVCARFGINEQESGQTLRAVGNQLGISKERVRQLQMQALEKLKEVLIEEKNVIQQIENM
jgi:RNA polymerase sigma factor (sigma-70 family)